MKIADIRKKKTADLEKELAKLEAQLRDAPVEKITKDEKNYKLSRNVRKDIARIKTVLTEQAGQPVDEKETK